MGNSILFTILISLFFAITASAVIFHKSPIQQNEQLCRTFDEKVNNYQMHMKNDDHSMKTLAFYQRQADEYCSQYFEEAHNCITGPL